MPAGRKPALADGQNMRMGVRRRLNYLLDRVHYRESENGLEFRDPEITSVLDSETERDMAIHLAGFAANMGFKTASAVLLLDQPDGGLRTRSVHNMPPAYEASFSNFDLGRVDPVSQHCKVKTTPLVWDQSTYTAAGKGNLWESQQQFGIASGIALALHLRAGRHMMIGIDSPDRVVAKGSELTHIVSRLQLYSVYLERAAEKIMLPKILISPDAVALPAMTGREIECLRWSSDGKTTWEVSQILGVSESAVGKFLASAMAKLDCVSKTHMIVKAMRLGLIS